MAFVFASALLVLTSFSFISSVCGYHPRHFINTGHLPAPVAGCVGGGLFAGLSSCSVLTGFITAFLSLTGFIASSAISEWLKVKTVPANEQSLFNENPIENADQDKYSFKPRAERLANKINSNCGPILIIGRYGSGKSSLTNLIFERLKKIDNIPSHPGERKNPQWILVRTSGWGLQDPESRAREILGSVCEKIQDKIDTIALREGCKGYLRSTFGDIHWIAKITFGLQRRSFQDLTSQMDNLLELSGMRVLLVLDDFERNAISSNGKYNWHAGLSEVIEHLKSSRNIKIIACVTQESVQ